MASIFARKRRRDGLARFIKRRSGGYFWDTIPGANLVGGWGVDRMLSSYSGNLLRVRRSSDNAEADFKDKTLIAAWVGVGNEGYVTTLYDQSGNGNDITQTTAANQPKIVIAGVLSDGVDFTAASSQYMNIPNNASLQITAVPISFVFDFYPLATTGYIINKNNTTVGTIQYAVVYLSAGTVSAYFKGQLEISSAAGGIPSAQTRVGISCSLTNRYVYKNGVQNASDGAFDPGVSGDQTSFYLGCTNSGGAPASFYNGKLRNIAVVNTALTTVQLEKL